MQVTGLWGEPGVPRGNPHRRRENIQTSLREAAARVQTRNLLAARSKLLTTVPQQMSVSCIVICLYCHIFEDIFGNKIILIRAVTSWAFICLLYISVIQVSQ